MTHVLECATGKMPSSALPRRSVNLWFSFTHDLNNCFALAVDLPEGMSPHTAGMRIMEGYPTSVIYIGAHFFHPDMAHASQNIDLTIYNEPEPSEEPRNTPGAPKVNRHARPAISPDEWNNVECARAINF